MSNKVTKQALEQWSGDFGAEYIKRNQVTDDRVSQATEVFRRVLCDSGKVDGLTNILEVGANVGINLSGLRNLFGKELTLAAVEPNKTAAARLKADAKLNLSQVIEGACYEVALPDNSFDLVFTSGVLIHVPPESLATAMKEITRLANKYVLCLEYFSHSPVEVPYHNHAGLLWKRDYGQKYLEVCPQLKTLAYGFIWQEEFSHFDNLNWWLFSKSHDC